MAAAGTFERGGERGIDGAAIDPRAFGPRHARARNATEAPLGELLPRRDSATPDRALLSRPPRARSSAATNAEFASACSARIIQRVFSQYPLKVGRSTLYRAMNSADS